MTIEDNTSVSFGKTPDDVRPDPGAGPPQRMRLFVPTANADVTLGLSNDLHYGVIAQTQFDFERFDGAERAVTSIGLGVNEQGFVGIIGMADHGNVFLCATGAADLGRSYRTVSRVNTVVETAMNVVRTGLLLWSARYHAGQTAHLATAMGYGLLGWNLFNAAVSPMSGAASSGFTNNDYLQTGHLGLFGARSVKLDSIEGISSSAALFNSHSAGLASSLNSIVSASINSGILADVKAGYAATMTSQSSAVIGGGDAGISSRVGTTRVEGKSIRIGNRKQAGAKAQYLSGIQERTDDLWMRAANYVEVGVPSSSEVQTPADDVLDGHLIGMLKPPNGMQVMRGFVRLSSNKASIKLAADATTMVGRNLVRVGSKAVEIGQAMTPVSMVTNAQLEAARLAYNTTWAASEGVVNQIGAVLSKVRAAGALGILGGVATYAAGAAAVAGAGAGAGAVAEGGDKKAIETGAIIGASVGAAGVLAAMTMVAMKAAGKVQRAGQAAAQKAFEAANRIALLNELPLSMLSPAGAKIVVKDDTIVLSVGPLSSVTITADSVKISALSVKINDIDLAPGLPAPPAPPVPPDVEPPPVDVPIPADGPAAEALAAAAVLV